MDYVLLKITQVSCIAISYTLFVVRGVWMMRDSALLQRRWVRIVPHVVDTALLASAIALAIIIHQYPFVNGWLTAKIVGLLAYIGLGMIALRSGKTRATRRGVARRAGGVFLYRRGRAYAPAAAVAGVTPGILPVSR